MRNCPEYDLTDYCYSDLEVWEFESMAQAEEIIQRIRGCQKETLAEVRQDIGLYLPLPGLRRWLYGALGKDWRANKLNGGKKHDKYNENEVLSLLAGKNFRGHKCSPEG